FSVRASSRRLLRFSGPRLRPRRTQLEFELFKRGKIVYPLPTNKFYMSKKLRFGLPKGSLQEATIEKMAKAGFNIQVSSRSYIPYVDDDEMEIRLIRAQEISRYVEHGYLDCGITGYDWIIENGSKVAAVGGVPLSQGSPRPG